MQAKILLAFSLLFLALCLPLALAGPQVELTPIKNLISPAEEASFSLKITNLMGEKQRYGIYSLQNAQGWNVEPSPLRDRIIEIEPRQSYTTKIIVEPLELFNPGIYYVYITIESDLGGRTDETLKIYLGPEKPLEYLPNILATVDMNEKIDSSQPLPVKLFLENRNPLNLTGLKVRLQSDIPEFAQEAVVDLPPLGKKTVELAILPNKYQQPKEYMLFFLFERQGQTVKILDKRVEILPQTPAFTRKVNEESTFLKTVTQVIVKNEGNVRNTQEVSLPVSRWRAWFTSSEAEEKEIGGQDSLLWEVSLSPEESTTLMVITNYRLLFYLGILLVLLLCFYLSVRSLVSVHKTAQAVKSAEEGTLSELKVTLEVKNLASRPLYNVSIADSVPGIANLEKSLELGTLKPHQFKHTPKGTKVIWEIAELEGHEHRLITYNLKAKLNVLGVLSLPRATVEYKPKRGRRRKSYSNVFRLSG